MVSEPEAQDPVQDGRKEAWVDLNHNDNGPSTQTPVEQSHIDPAISIEPEPAPLQLGPTTARRSGTPRQPEVSTGTNRPPEPGPATERESGTPVKPGGNTPITPLIHDPVPLLRKARPPPVNGLLFSRHNPDGPPTDQNNVR